MKPVIGVGLLIMIASAASAQDRPLNASEVRAQIISVLSTQLMDAERSADQLQMQLSQAQARIADLVSKCGDACAAKSPDK